jgi:hypothetical protein
LNSAKPSTFFCRFLVVHISPTRTGELKSSPAEPHTGGRHTYDRVLPGAPKGSFVTLLSPPQCHADFDTMPHTLASVDQSHVCRPRTLPLPRRGRLGLDFGGIIALSCEPGSSVIVSGYGLDDRAIEVRSPEGANDFSSILCVQTGSGALPAS